MPVRRAGFEFKDFRTQRRDVNEDKLSNNLIRAKSKVFEYAMCNEFEHFVTLTLDKNKYDRHNLNKYIKDLGQFIRDYRKKYDVNIQYLLIPEQHKDGAWHMHGLFKGIPEEHLKPFTLEDNIPHRLKQMIIEGRTIYNWERYANKFGWCTLEAVISQEAISKYITKYITKALEIGGGVTEKNKKLYYASRGLATAEKVREGTLTSSQLDKIPFEFENEYICSLTINKAKNPLHMLLLDNILDDKGYK